MDDTSPRVKQIQLAIWLAKSPEERLRLTLQNNDDLVIIWNELRKNYKPPTSIDPVNKQCSK